MATPSRKYTRRTTRDRLVDLLEEAIKLVKIRCVGPEGPSDILKTARREFQEAADMKNQAAALLKSARDTPYPQDATPFTSTGFAEAPEVPEAEVPEAEVLQAEVPQATQVPLATSAPPPPSNTNLSITRKKLPSCPGGPKAFNEFLKSKRAEVEANLGPNAKYANVRAEIAKRWKETCKKTNTKKLPKTKATKTVATPGRVNAPSTLLEAAPEPEVMPEPEVVPAAEVASEVASEALTPLQEGYEDEGLDDTLGMRRISIEGRPLYMTNSNKGLFDRSNDELGSFIGYLRNGKIVLQDAPNDV